MAKKQRREDIIIYLPLCDVLETPIEEREMKCKYGLDDDEALRAQVICRYESGPDRYGILAWLCEGSPTALVIVDDPVLAKNEAEYDRITEELMGYGTELILV